MVFERSDRPDTPVRIELGERMAFYTESILTLGDPTLQEEFDGHGNAIEGYAIINAPKVAVRSMGRGRLDMITYNGNIWIVYLPEVNRTVAISFDELRSWNPGLTVPPAISWKKFRRRSFISGSIAALLGAVAGREVASQEHAKKLERVEL